VSRIPYADRVGDFQTGAFRLRGEIAGDSDSGAKTSATASAAGVDWDRFAAMAASRAFLILEISPV
jgi:hypothetical protein